MRPLSRPELAETLARLPRFELGSLPTPLQRLPRLSERLGGPEIWVKRDDLTGLAFGGNKVRQLEYFVGDALAGDADVLIGGGSYAQSNHARVCSAAARAAGMTPVIVVRPSAAAPVDARRCEGNALVTEMLTDDVRVAPELGDAPTDRLGEVEARREVFGAVAEEYRRRGHRPYVVLGTSVGLGVIGYVAAVLELQQQFEQVGLQPEWVVVTSLGATQAGLEVGSRLLGLPWKVCGMAYRPAMARGGEIVSALAADAARLLDVDLTLPADEIVNLDESAGPAYAVASSESRAAIDLACRTEALLLDPVYTAKGMAGLVRAIEEKVFSAGETVVFVHTGGLPALFAGSGETPRS